MKNSDPPAPHRITLLFIVYRHCLPYQTERYSQVTPCSTIQSFTRSNHAFHISCPVSVCGREKWKKEGRKGRREERNKKKKALKILIIPRNWGCYFITSQQIGIISVIYRWFFQSKWCVLLGITFFNFSLNWKISVTSQTLGWKEE